MQTDDPFYKAVRACSRPCKRPNIFWKSGFYVQASGAQRSSEHQNRIVPSRPQHDCEKHILTGEKTAVASASLCTRGQISSALLSSSLRRKAGCVRRKSNKHHEPPFPAEARRSRTPCRRFLLYFAYSPRIMTHIPSLNIIEDDVGRSTLQKEPPCDDWDLK